jgi:hypothetical protein
MQVTPPILSRLLALHRVVAHRRVVAGDFGQVHRRGQINEVELAEVADAVGIDFSREQLSAAGLSIPIQEPEDI